MVFKSFRLQLGLRLAGLFATMAMLALGLVRDHPGGWLITLVIAVVLLMISIVRYINYTNRELEAFLAGLRFGDFQQSYTIRHLGPSFARLEEQMQRAMQKLKAMRSRKEQEAAWYQALLRHLPVPFLVVAPDGRVTVLNHATRRTFNVAEIGSVEQLGAWGHAFQRDVAQIQPGETVLTTVNLAGSEAQYLLTATQLSTGGKPQKLVALQNVQEELDATEVEAWQNLLRVISHEILNSLAPVSSCAQTAHLLVDDLLEQPDLPSAVADEMQDIRDSIETVQRRSDGLARFVRSYRQLTRLPPPERQRVSMKDYLASLQSLVSEELARKNIQLEISLATESLQLAADPDMLDQAMINLVRNAADALQDVDQGVIRISAKSDERQRIRIEVSDNGPGVPENIRDNIFFPFFTTREQGSGVGLALVRYIMISHGGSVGCDDAPGGGARFWLLFQ